MSLGRRGHYPQFSPKPGHTSACDGGVNLAEIIWVFMDKQQRLIYVGSFINLIIRCSHNLRTTYLAFSKKVSLNKELYLLARGLEGLTAHGQNMTDSNSHLLQVAPMVSTLPLGVVLAQG
jgi:hypothetical protein